MVGPSSSHTAGAVRMGYVARKLLGFQPAQANIALHGSFAATGAGHGTDKAIVAGLLSMKPNLRDAHPNTAVMTLIGERGRTVVVNASSLGGGRVRVNSIDGMAATFSADMPTLIVRNRDKPGIVAEVSTYLARNSVNIANMQLYRNRQEDLSVMVLECDLAGCPAGRGRRWPPISIPSAAPSFKRS